MSSRYVVKLNKEQFTIYCMLLFARRMGKKEYVIFTYFCEKKLREFVPLNPLHFAHSLIHLPLATTGLFSN